jgi:hypothetical protein
LTGSDPPDGLEPPKASHRDYWAAVLKAQAANKLTDLGYPSDWQQWEVVGPYSRADDWEFTHVRTTMQGVTIVQPVKSQQHDGGKAWHVDWDLTAEQVAALPKPPPPARSSAAAPAAGGSRPPEAKPTRPRKARVSPEDDLKRRALAAAAAEQARQDERDRLTRQQEAGLDTRMCRELEEDAAAVASEILAYPNFPSQWKASRQRHYDTDYGITYVTSEYWVAWATIEGVGLITSIRPRTDRDRLPPRIFVGTTSGPLLTLASFGQALEARRRQETAPDKGSACPEELLQLTGKLPAGNGRAAADPGLVRSSGLVRVVWVTCFW